MLNEKRKVQALFERNGGPLLASINNIKIYTKQELTQITRNFSSVIGKGSVGEVYKGTTNNNQTVAVKAISVVKEGRYPEVDEIRKTEFANEIKIQSQIIHKNIVKLLGCCLEVEIPICWSTSLRLMEASMTSFTVPKEDLFHCKQGWILLLTLLKPLPICIYLSLQKSSMEM